MHESTTVGESTFTVTDLGSTGSVEYLIVDGGGGAGEAGGTDGLGRGVDGVSSSITGTGIIRGGAFGGILNGTTAPNGGGGGGGSGGFGSGSDPAVAGAANTGGGQTAGSAYGAT